MDHKIEQVFFDFKDVFLGKQEEIKNFLIKYSERFFKGKKIIRVERIDETDQIEKSGFRKNIGSWRDADNNIIISTCLVIEGSQKRFDYKFQLGEKGIAQLVEETTPNATEEDIINEEQEIATPKTEIEEDFKEKEIEKKMDNEPPLKEELEEEEMELVRKIEEAYHESIQLSQSFHFDSQTFSNAIGQLDSMIAGLQEKNLPEYSKLLEDKRQHLLEAQELYDKDMERLQRLENKIDEIINVKGNIQDSLHYEEAILKISEIINVLQEQDIPEYSKKLEQKRAELIASQKALETSEEKESEEPIDLIEENETINEASLDIPEVLEVPEEEIFKKIEGVYKEGFNLRQRFEFENQTFESAITHLDSMIEDLKEKNLPDYSKLLEEKRQYLINAQGNYEKRTEDLSELKQKVIEIMGEKPIIQDINQFEEAISKIDGLINQIQDKDLEDHLKMLDEKRRSLFVAREFYIQVKGSLSDIELKVEKTIKESQDLEDNFEFNDAILKIEELIKEVKNGNLMKQASLLETRRAELIERKEKYFEESIKLEDLKAILEETLETSSKLCEERRFKEALEKLDSTIDLFYEKNLSEYLKILQEKKHEILEIQDNF